ncbi:MAG TPA: Ni/Fe-hydrogenase cytochrome b subunit [Terriglobales bacterium]|nr:Ni/Fe-hydrogenase cytochrome b subunit [Terriglobales bacterium]
MIDRWERAVPVFNVPIWTKPFKALLGLGTVAVIITLYREVAGLGPVSGMNDAYAWGIWKTFNVMTLTGLGSGAFAIGISAWLFKKSKLHSVMRIALLTSFLAYLSGLILIGIDVGRPWNIIWLFTPWNWNPHSPLLEVMFCMPAYAMLPLFLENVPPVLEYFHRYKPETRQFVEKCERIMVKFYPFIVALAYILPAMHQSSLGALMLLGGDRVHGLWQSPFLPLLYVWAAAFLGVCCVAGTLLFCSLMWKRPYDMDVLVELNRLGAWLIGTWSLFRLLDLIISGRIKLAFALDIYAGLFWMEMAFLLVALYMLIDSAKMRDARLMFHAHVLVGVGGLLYRFNPTTLAFQAKPGAFYFPSALELLISLGFVALAIAGFSLAVKLLAILPAPNALWFQMEAREESMNKLHQRGVPVNDAAPSFTD